MCHLHYLWFPSRDKYRCNAAQSVISYGTSMAKAERAQSIELADGIPCLTVKGELWVTWYEYCWKIDLVLLELYWLFCLRCYRHRHLQNHNQSHCPPHQPPSPQHLSLLSHRNHHNHHHHYRGQCTHYKHGVNPHTKITVTTHIATTYEWYWCWSNFICYLWITIMVFVLWWHLR